MFEDSSFLSHDSHWCVLREDFLELILFLGSVSWVSVPSYATQLCLRSTQLIGIIESVFTFYGDLDSGLLGKAKNIGAKFKL